MCSREILLHCIIQATNSYSLAWKGINTTMVNHATVNHVVHYATLQNTELTIYHLSGNYSTSSDQDQILSRMYL